MVTHGSSASDNQTVEETASARADRRNKASARERLLEAANDLFYEEGVHTVGIERVIARAGVAKATLYYAFGSKEELIRAYLQARHDVTRRRMEAALETRYATARERLVGVFEVQGEQFSEPGFRGCAFINASAETYHGSPVEQVSDEARAWTRQLFLSLASEAGAPDPPALAHQLVVLYDGAAITARMDRDPSAAQASRAIAAAIVDASVPG
jgi:AcrR family transcriptional regulator